MRGHGGETAALDAFVSTFDYMMVVVTAARHGRRGGCLVGFATQCSIDPPRFLVCVSKANATARLVRRTRYVGVHQLGTDQEDLARLFGEQSGDWVDKFRKCRWHSDVHGVPVLDDAAAWVIGRIVDRVAFGDHTGLVLAPVNGAQRSNEPRLRFDTARTFDAGHPA